MNNSTDSVADTVVDSVVDSVVGSVVDSDAGVPDRSAAGAVIAAATGSKRSSRRASQNQQQAQFITAAGNTLAAALANAPLVAALSEFGLTTADLHAGLALQEQALAAFTVRQQARAAQQAAGAALHKRRSAAINRYRIFRHVVHALDLSPAACTALGAADAIPHDTRKFVTWAHAGYTTALDEEYAAQLARRGYGHHRILDALDELNALNAAQEAALNAAAAARQATSARNNAVRALRRWMQQYRSITSAARRSQPQPTAALNA